MKRKSAALALALPLLTGAVLLSGCGPKSAAPAASVTDANLVDKVQQARTPTDHQDIARYYDAQAQAAERQAAVDRKFRGSYVRSWPPGGPSEGPAAEGHYDSASGTATLTLRGFGPSAEGHYDRLIARDEDDAREYHALADWHRDLAGQVERGGAKVAE
ncbi:MAG: hypothetical protein ISP90_00135 [Nevskia sp.]|nr:hypothetical protein [Nevskia sp.]